MGKKRRALQGVQRRLDDEEAKIEDSLSDGIFAAMANNNAPPDATSKKKTKERHRRLKGNAAKGPDGPDSNDNNNHVGSPTSAGSAGNANNDLDLPTEYLPTPTPFDKPRSGDKPRKSFLLTPNSQGPLSSISTTFMALGSQQSKTTAVRSPQSQNEWNDDNEDDNDDGLGLNSSSILIFDPNTDGNKTSLADALGTPMTNSSPPTSGNAGAGGKTKPNGRPLFNLAEMKLTELCQGFVSYVSTNQGYRLARSKALSEVTDLLEDHGFKVDVYGSAKTGLMVPSSDLDISVAALSGGGSSHSTFNHHGGGHTHPQFNKVAKLFLTSPLFKRVIKITHARVPVIKCEHVETKIKLDVSFNRDGLVSSRYLLEKLRMSPLSGVPGTTLSTPTTLLGYRSQARNLILLVKHLLGDWQLDDPSCGGLGSFGVTLLVLFFCDSEVRVRMPNHLWSDVGALFRRFLLFYGQTFRFDIYIIDLEGGSHSLVPSVLRGSGPGKKNSSNSQQEAAAEEKEPVIQRKQYGDRQLHVKNPLEPHRNALSACKKFDQIKENFAAYGRSLNTNCNSTTMNLNALHNNFNRHFSQRSIEAPQLSPNGQRQWTMNECLELENRMGLFTLESCKNMGIISTDSHYSSFPASPPSTTTAAGLAAMTAGGKGNNIATHSANCNKKGVNQPTALGSVPNGGLGRRRGISETVSPEGSSSSSEGSDYSDLSGVDDYENWTSAGDDEEDEEEEEARSGHASDDFYASPAMTRTELQESDSDEIEEIFRHKNKKKEKMGNHHKKNGGAQNQQQLRAAKKKGGATGQSRHQYQGGRNSGGVGHGSSPFRDLVLKKPSTPFSPAMSTGRRSISANADTTTGDSQRRKRSRGSFKQD